MKQALGNAKAFQKIIVNFFNTLRMLSSSFFMQIQKYDLVAQFLMFDKGFNKLIQIYRILDINFLSNSSFNNRIFSMKSKSLKQSATTKYQPKIKVQPNVEPRRSTRQKKQPKDDQYWRGLPTQYDYFGVEQSDDDIYPKRRRRNNRFEDSQDYDGVNKNSKKKAINTNKIQALLQWRDQMFETKLSIIVDDDLLDSKAKEPQFSKLKISKNVSNQNLDEIGTNIEALFINIDWGKKGQTMKDFANLKIDSNKLMPKGLVFVWAPKQLVSQLLEVMGKKNFTYVQNLEVINLDRQKAIREYCPNIRSLPQIKQKKSSMSTLEDPSEPQTELKDIIKYLNNVDPSELIVQQSSPFFNKSKRTLLMFRKTSNLKIQLRHQRTCDVVFDMPVDPSGKCQQSTKKYIYTMIQTLLPECLQIQYKNKTQLGFKMMQLWADKNSQPRRGWINVVQA